MPIMLKIARWHIAIATCCALGAALTACAGNANVPATPMAAASLAHSPIRPDTGPPSCKGQNGTTEFAAATETLRASGGLLCIPAFANFGGTLAYPSVKPAGSIQVTSSTSNFDSLPSDSKGKALFYLQFVTTAPTTFGKNFRKTGAFVGKSIKAGATYTIYGAAKSGGVAILITTFPPCYTVATAGTYGGKLASIGSVLAGEKLAQPSTVTVQVYAKKLATAKC
jgi:hypothetical protein